MNNFENYEYEPIDLCACYEPMFDAPQELIDEWNAAYAEPDEVPTFYVEDEYRTRYFYRGIPVFGSLSISTTKVNLLER